MTLTMFARRGKWMLAAFLLARAGAAPAPIRAYTVAEGLAHDHVSRIFRDAQGFLWICTDEGLSRFDGHRFANFTTADGLPHIHVNDIAQDRAGDYWIGTDGGLALYRPARPAGPRFSTFRPEGPPQALYVNSVLPEADGSVLAGTDGGLYRLRLDGRGPGRFERIDFHPPPDWPKGPAVNTLLRSADALWVGTPSGLYRQDASGRWTRFGSPDSLPHDDVECLVADGRDAVWACTGGGLVRIEPGRRRVDAVFTAADGLPHPKVRALLIAGDGRRWIGTLGGLVEWLPGTPLRGSRVYTRNDGLTDHEIYALAADQAANLWMGTRRGGLMRLRQPVFQNFGESDGLRFSGTDELVQTPSGAVCVAAISDPRRTVRCLEGSRFRPLQPSLPPRVVRHEPFSFYSTIADHAGAWWISTEHGLFHSSGPIAAGLLPTSALQPERLLSARRLFEDSRGDLWIGTLDRGTAGTKKWEFGLRRWERATSRLHNLSAALPAETRDREPYAFAEAGGYLWIGLTRPGGLLRFRNGRSEQIAGAPAGTVQALFRDRRGRLWMASAESGIGRIDDPAALRVSMRVYDRAAGLSSNEVWCFAEDRKGRIYAGTARGVDRLDPESGEITHWTQADGLSGGGIRSALASRNGDLWFLSNSGLSRMPGRGEDAAAAPLAARIMAVRVGGAPQPVSDNGETEVAAAEFPWYQNSVEIDFAAIDFLTPEQLRFQFRLEGGRARWSDPTPNSTVHFSNLAPGRYRFLVRAAAPDGHASGSPAQFAFAIAPPWWKRGWFVALSGALVAVLAFLLHRSSLHRQLALERVRSRIATDLHDDLGASLARIAVFSEAILTRASVGDAVSRRMLGEIADTSRAVVEAMSDIVWSIDPRRDSVGDLVARLRAFGSDLLESQGISWTCEETTAAGLRQALSPDQRREMFLIFKEAIHNIARHSRARAVSLRVEVGRHAVSGEIQDDGIGFAQAADAGLGLASMRARAARLGGELQIGPGPGSGTRIRLRFPLKQRHA